MISISPFLLRFPIDFFSSLSIYCMIVYSFSINKDAQLSARTNTLSEVIQNDCFEAEMTFVYFLFSFLQVLSLCKVEYIYHNQELCNKPLLG